MEHRQNNEVPIAKFYPDIQGLNIGIFHLLSMRVDCATRNPGRPAGIEDNKGILFPDIGFRFFL